MMTQFAKNYQRIWDAPLPELQLVFNTTITWTIRFSPAYLIQGRELKLPKDLYDEVAPNEFRNATKGKDIGEGMRETFTMTQGHI